MSLAGRRVLVLGLGETGLAAAHWAAREGARLRIADTRAVPPKLDELRRTLPEAELRCGTFAPELLEGVDLIVPSPGLPLEDPFVQAALAGGIALAGEIELFAWALRSRGRGKVIAVTGTNGKTTVTAMTGHLLRTAGIDCEIAGNIGPAVLAALAARVESCSLPAVWVLELSSYQLESTWTLAPDAAAMLNLSEDHLDRYASITGYGMAKERIFLGAGTQVLNRDDARSLAMAIPGRRRVSFGLGAPEGAGDFGLVSVDGADWIARGGRRIVATGELRLRGAHNAANAMAAAALSSLAGADADAIAAGLRSFAGLPHRFEPVRAIHDVVYIDDSKATNVGATLAALNGLGRPAVLILGGEGKGQDFTPLANAVARHAKRVLLIGCAAPRIAAALAAAGVPLENCASLEQAVGAAARAARPGDAVLLSPACASFDMFLDYKHRGEVFARAVRELAP
ncbi:MAG: UDP-N-acetylmuramoyl-L-alanine--D-glutamate ligase [Betaproteobacteria bacterium]|nr:UDP-N-acetylmuramoyl-L-alanine--D-glutamate ligase [Betaproteobacteria bacterium]